MHEFVQRRSVNLKQPFLICVNDVKPLCFYLVVKSCVIPCDREAAYAFGILFSLFCAQLKLSKELQVVLSFYSLSSKFFQLFPEKRMLLTCLSVICCLFELVFWNPLIKVVPAKPVSLDEYRLKATAKRLLG